MNLLPPFLIIYKLLLYKISYQLSLPLVFETFVVAPWLMSGAFCYGLQKNRAMVLYQLLCYRVISALAFISK